MSRGFLINLNKNFKKVSAIYFDVILDIFFEMWYNCYDSGLSAII